MIKSQLKPGSEDLSTGFCDNYQDISCWGLGTVKFTGFNTAKAKNEA